METTLPRAEFIQGSKYFRTWARCRGYERFARPRKQYREGDHREYTYGICSILAIGKSMGQIVEYAAESTTSRLRKCEWMPASRQSVCVTSLGGGFLFLPAY